jgi:hypothetical protein
MSDYREMTIGKAAALAAPAAAGSGASATLLGLNAEHWAMLASIATFVYCAVLLVLALPRLLTMVRHYWRKFIGRFQASNDDEAGA